MTSTQTQTQGAQPIKFKIVISADGKLGMFSESGTLQAGTEQMEKLLALLAASSVSVGEVSPPEQHRHDDDPEAVLSQAHAMSHSH